MKKDIAWLIGWKKHTSLQRHTQTESKRIANGIWTQAGIATLISDKTTSSQN
jgi:hypothetical protein